MPYHYDACEWKSVAEIISNLVTALAVIAGGGWALWRFGIQREAHAKIEFGLQLNVLGRQGGSLLVEVIANVTNKGLVRQWRIPAS